MERIATNLQRVVDRIRAAARRAGRDPDGVILVGVTKTVPVERIAAAADAGLVHVGENRVQEAVTKVQPLADCGARLTWHLVGHLQSNKAKRAAGIFDWIHSLSGADLAGKIDGAVPEGASPIPVLIQVDLGKEPTKHGVPVEEVATLARAATRLPRLRPCGLMTIPPMADDPEASRPFFRRLREIREALAADGLDLPHLSMGMTDDFEVAIEEGATLVRVGRAIFGERQRPR